MSKYKHGLVPPVGSPLWDEIKTIGWEKWFADYLNSPECKQRTDEMKDIAVTEAEGNLKNLMDLLRIIYKENSKPFTSTKIALNYVTGKKLPTELLELEVSLNSIGYTLKVGKTE